MWVGFDHRELHSIGSTEKYKVAVRYFWYRFKTNANTRKKLKTYHKSPFYCKSDSAKAGSYHKHTVSARAFFETFIALDRLIRPLLKPTSSWTGCHFAFEIEFQIWYEKHNDWAVCTEFEEAKSVMLYSIVTNSLELSIPVSLRGSTRKMFHIYPKKFNQAMHVNVEKPTVGGFGIKGSATLVYLTRREDSLSRGKLYAIFVFS